MVEVFCCSLQAVTLEILRFLIDWRRLQGWSSKKREREKRLGAFPQLLSSRYQHILPMLSPHPSNVIQCYPHILPSIENTEPLFFPRTTIWQPRRLGLMGYASGEVLIALTPLHPSEADPGHMTTILQSEDAHVAEDSSQTN